MYPKSESFITGGSLSTSEVYSSEEGGGKVLIKLISYKGVKDE